MRVEINVALSAQAIKFQELYKYPIMIWSCFGFECIYNLFYLWFTLNEKLNKVKIVIFKDWRLVICAMCFDNNFATEIIEVICNDFGIIGFSSSDAGDRIFWL